MPRCSWPAFPGHELSGRSTVIHLYDTARQRVVPFEPGELVTLYSCGITPYDSAHLGHAQV
ncbi:MAG: cysteine--1-D-myo-inosityl 2-amino-2-deoxy-alpha-D-glucopyranoside ligase, partial [Acidimicrobiales bacterium]